jgi:hypothetical protein
MSTHTFSPQSQAAIDRFRAALAWSAQQDSPQDAEPEGFDFVPLRVSVTVMDGTDEWEDFMFAQGIYPDEPYYEVCECEQDWRCGLHAGQPTWLETRYDFSGEPAWAQ